MYHVHMTQRRRPAPPESALCHRFEKNVEIAFFNAVRSGLREKIAVFYHQTALLVFSKARIMPILLKKRPYFGSCDTFHIMLFS